ncbi:hypothetical protein [Desulfurococcus amylolyticus]|uniref:hypothetical protein n=1 Tax=Desulfurococcus amylolyticus TaxID=94694 RepID=UPI0023F2C807|nr:hypothetical protein [Desulfurococcus amylolyticus]
MEENESKTNVELIEEEEFKTETKTPKEVFEKYYVKAALKNNSAIVSLDDIYDEVRKSDNNKKDAIDVFIETDEYYFNWMIFAFEDAGDLVAVPSLTEKLKDMKLAKVIAWMYVNEIPQEKIEKFIHDATLSCLRENSYIEDILALAKKYYRVEEDWSNFNEDNYSGRIVYSIYDNGELLGKITEEVEYCNSCICDGVFNDGAGCYENFIEKCVSWYFGEQKDEEL